MRFVLDTNVIVSALFWNGLPRTLLHSCQANGILIFTSPPMLLELMDTLAKPKFSEKVKASGFPVSELVVQYASKAIVVRALQIPRLAPDPDDDMVIGTAIASRADLIVTGDRALRSVANFGTGRIVSVVEALSVIG